MGLTYGEIQYILLKMHYLNLLFQQQSQKKMLQGTLGLRIKNSKKYCVHIK